MKVSKVKGRIDSSSKVQFRQADGEIFWRLPLVLDETELELVISEYLLRDLDGNVELIGYIRTEKKKRGLDTFFQAIAISPINEVDDDWTIEIDGCINKIYPPVIKESGRSYRHIVVQSNSDDRNTNVWFITLFDLAVRKSNELERGMAIKGSGKLYKGKKLVIYMTDYERKGGVQNG